MKKIVLQGKYGQGKYTLVDDEDFDFVSQWKWIGHSKGYARKNRIFLHRLILKIPKGKEIDHINGNRLDNRKANLRIVTSQQNKMNRASCKNSSSRFKGVVWSKVDKKWQSQIVFMNKHFYLGRFDSEKEAAITYNKAALKYHGEFARLNLIN